MEPWAGELDTGDSFTPASSRCDENHASVGHKISFGLRFLAGLGDGDLDVGSTIEIMARDKSGAGAADILAVGVFLELHAIAIEAA